MTEPGTRTSLRTTSIAIAALIAVTGAMLVLRDRLDKAHVALLYVLVVLGGSAMGGRVIGFALGGLAFLLFNVLFLPPYYTLAIADPFDWLVLVAFLATSVVAAELLDRQQRHAALAELRARELDQLATLGAETLNAARAERALAAIAAVIRQAIDVDQCQLFVREAEEEEGALRCIADTGGELAAGARVTSPGGLLSYVVATPRAAIEREDGTIHVVEEPGADARYRFPGLARAYAAPLSIRGKTVGALRISVRTNFSLTVEQTRVLSTLAYYAALGIERLRLEQSEETAEELRRVDRLKDALLASVSHDLRTPLTTIKGIAEEIAGDGHPRARVIEEEADRLSSLVEGLLELSQLNAGALPVRRALNTIDDLVGAALQRAETVLRGHPVDALLDDDRLLVGEFDFSHSLRILVNLLENAAKYSPADAPISIRAARRVEFLEVVVADRGAGIPASERERVFEPFYRMPGATPDVRGAGLGLSIARRLARTQGGNLSVGPRDGGGSNFVLELPAGADPLY